MTNINELLSADQVSATRDAKINANFTALNGGKIEIEGEKTALQFTDSFIILDKTLASPVFKKILYENAIGSGGSGNDIEYIEAGENIQGTLSNPQALFFNTSDSKVYLTSALEGKYIGLTTETVSAGDLVKIIKGGLLDVSGFVSQNLYYARDDVRGDLTLTATSLVVGQSISDTKLLVSTNRVD